MLIQEHTLFQFYDVLLRFEPITDKSKLYVDVLNGFQRISSTITLHPCWVWF